ncbi:hypothetical protein [Streptomyces xanthii]|uniref:Translation initiation factor 2 n=1 Tax=Streptomyces xanthii TaxID=2768069 RepID=A0A7H1B386_9ACTN|nr:hypothetical protein [Streptomyces xanthii]QNS03191.1 hypothetical protein IAG42_05855 [Streptomyces xanthii]
MFGLSPEWLLGPDGAPVADALVLSHPEQEERLRAVCPEAAHTGVLAGDPCWDRILAARAHRDRYRRALGVRAGQRLVLLSSTWGPDALFGDGGDDTLPALLPRLTSELPVDTHRLAAVLHPNLWHGHGPGQIRSWLDRARRAGLTLIDPLHGWRQALIAADAVIGDHGAVTYYAAALGTPVLLGAAPLSALAPDAPVHAFVRSAPRLDPAAPLRPQLDALLARHRPLPEAAEFVSAVPHEAAPRLRRLFHQLLDLPEPPWPARLAPLPLPPYEPAEPSVPLHVRTWITGPGEVRLERYAGPHPAPCGEDGAVAHTALHEDTREQDRLGLADAVFRYGAADDPRLGPPERWAAETLDRFPQCALAAYATGPAECVVRTRTGALVELSGPDGPDPAANASALHAWLAAGKDVAELADSGLLLDTSGAGTHRVRVTLR